MCGLCGVFGLIGLEEKKAFSYLQLFSQTRGRDSTGLAVIPFTHAHPIKLFKELGGIETLVFQNQDVFDQSNWQVKSAVGGLCFIGHHRHCTRGAVTVANAHPFDLDNIVGCHNGTLSDSSLTNLPSYDKSLIDSQVILKEVDSGRPLKEIIKDVKGAWALVWWDKETQTLNMCRNDERSLYVAIVSEGRSILWASEHWMLDIALHKAGFGKNKFKILETAPHKHLIWGRDTKYRIELKDSLCAKSKDDTDWGDWIEEQMPTKRKLITESKVIDINKNKKRKRITYKHPKDGKSKREEFTEVYARTFNGMYIKRAEYEYLTKRGCSWCSVTDNVSWDQRENVYWCTADRPVCEVCNGGNEAEAAARKVH